MALSVFFELDQNLGTGACPEVLGGKAYGLHEMFRMGFPVPPAMVIPTHWCQTYRDAPIGTMALIREQLPGLKEYFISKFGYMPLLSVRSGARVSMPGMMDTILNVGMDGTNKFDWAGQLGMECAKKCANRFDHQYRELVLGAPSNMSYIIPDADDQIVNCIEAVFKSWDNARAKHYRKMHNIPEEWGTAVILQAMVFGNFNDKSATGVLFTRNPDTGENTLTGEFLVNAQGEDIVDGSHTPRPFAELSHWDDLIAASLTTYAKQLEELRGDVQDIEWTVQDGKLYLLQTRNAKRSSRAAIRIAVDKIQDKHWTLAEARKKVSRLDFVHCYQPVIDPSFEESAEWVGTPACAGVAVGKIVKSAAAAIDCAEPCILVTETTNPDDIAGMEAAMGILTMKGGITCHAAVVARAMNKPCVVGLGQTLSWDNFKEGDILSIDGSTGEVWKMAVPVIKGGEDDPYLAKFIEYLAVDVGVKLIGERDTPMLDVSGMTPERAAFVVEKTLQKIEGEVLVDVSSTSRDPVLQSFLGADSAGHERDVVLGIAKLVPFDLQGRIRCISTISTEAVGLSRLPCLRHPEELLDVEPGQRFVYQGAHDERAQKVLRWLKGDGCEPALVGVISKSGYASPFQLAEALLT